MRDLRKGKEEVQAQGETERKTYTEKWKETQRRNSSNLGRKCQWSKTSGHKHLLMKMLWHKEGLDSGAQAQPARGKIHSNIQRTIPFNSCIHDCMETN